MSYYVNRSATLDQSKRNWRIWETEVQNNLRSFSHFQQSNWCFNGSFQSHSFDLQYIELTGFGFWSQKRLRKKMTNKDHEKLNIRNLTTR